MRWVTAAVLAMLVASARPASACDPYWDWCGNDWYDAYWDLPAYEEPSIWWWEDPIYEPAPVYEPIPVYVPPALIEPVAVAPPSFEPAPEPIPAVAWTPPPTPAWSEPLPWSAPGSDVLSASVAPTTQPAPVPVLAAPDLEAERIALGLHKVSEAWTGHVVTNEGPVTTFSSTSVALDTGTSARLVASVGTGEGSAYDGLLSGGRMTLSDGRLVKGNVYANYVWNGYEWVLDRYVFFQDDLEIAPPAPVAVGPVMPIPPPPAAVVPPIATSPVPAAAAAPPVASPPAFAAPIVDDVPPGPAAVPPPGGGSSQPTPREIRAGIALAPQAEPLGRIEVLRGRSVPLWLRATIDGTPARVLRWDLLSGELIALGPVSGSGDEPLVATWRSVTAPGAAFAVRLRASVDVPGDVAHEIDAVIDVVVRSPALVD